MSVGCSVKLLRILLCLYCVHSGWCQRLLTSGNTQHMSTVVKLLTTLLGQVHMDHRQSPSATPALLVQLDLTDGCSQSLASQESSESRHICSACLCSYLVEAFEGDSEATHIFNSRPPAAAHSLLTSLLAVSVEARKHAVKGISHSHMRTHTHADGISQLFKSVM